MTSLVAWVGADTHGPSSLNIATDSRITWPRGASVAYSWDQGKKIFGSTTRPLLVAFTGDVLFPSLVIPGIMDRIDRGVWPKDGAFLEGFIGALRLGWGEYPSPERRPLNLYIAHREGDGMSSEFRLAKLSHKMNDSRQWFTEEIAVPRVSTCLAIDGSGKAQVQDALAAWKATEVGDTSRAVFSGFVDGVISGVDPGSGGAPQLGSLYRVGGGRLLGVVHNDRRYFAGSHLVGMEAVEGVEWRNALFERADGRTKSRLNGAQAQPRPVMN